jgi:hypothetical protein
MCNKKDKDNETLPVEQVAPLANESIPATLNDIKRLEASIMSQMQSMLAVFLAPKKFQFIVLEPLPRMLPLRIPSVRLSSKRASPLRRKRWRAPTHPLPRKRMNLRIRRICRVNMRFPHKVITLLILIFLCPI